MKRLTAMLLCLSVLMLSACSAQPAQFHTGLIDELSQCGAFSEELAALDGDTLWVLYALDSAGLRRDALIDAAGLRSTGATCEEAAVLLFPDEAAAKAACDALRTYLDRQLTANRTYRPAEIPKLEQAVLQHRGATLLLLVAADYDAAASVLH